MTLPINSVLFKLKALFKASFYKEINKLKILLFVNLITAKPLPIKAFYLATAILSIESAKSLKCSLISLSVVFSGMLKIFIEFSKSDSRLSLYCMHSLQLLNCSPFSMRQLNASTFELKSK